MDDDIRTGEVIKELRVRLQEVESKAALRTLPSVAEDVQAKIEVAVEKALREVWEKVQELEEWIAWYEWPLDEDKGREKASDQGRSARW